MRLLDPSSLFVGAAIATIVLTMSALMIKGRALPNLEASTEQMVEYRSRAGSPTGKNSLLMQLNLKNEREMASYAHYVAEIIKSQKKKPADAMKEANKLAMSIVKESIRADFDPLLAAAIIKMESTFKADARSPVGARGLMQIMPLTGPHASKLADSSWSGVWKLTDPQYNLRLGISYFKYVLKLFRGNTELALIAYNWGPENLRVALKDRKRIPMGPIKYARTILRNYNFWKKELERTKSQFQYFNPGEIKPTSVDMSNGVKLFKIH